jgi:predicted nucleic acid-binding protein
MTRVLLDTNILLRLTQPSQALHAEIISSIKLLHERSVRLCIVPQTLYEFWSVATRPIAANGLGMDKPAVEQSVDWLLDDFDLLRDERGVFRNWHDLVRQHTVQGKSVHDARIVAAMQRHGLRTILTLNSRDFVRYSIVLACTPGEILAGTMPV